MLIGQLSGILFAQVSLLTATWLGTTQEAQQEASG
jgi:hypothetical protein